jgi:hypothetical protein
VSFNRRYVFPGTPPIGTAVKMHPDVGRRGLYHVKGLHFEVEILDVKFDFGAHYTYKVKPVAGKGEVWTRSVTVYADPPPEESRGVAG